MCVSSQVVSGTYADNLVLCTRSQEPAVRAEAHATNVQIAILRRLVVLQMTDLLPRRHVEDLRAAIAARRHEPPVVAEAHTADHALMGQVVHQIHVQTAVHARVEDGVPVLALALEVRWQLLWLKLRELVADLLELGMGVLEVGRDLLVLVWGWGWAGDVWRAWIRVRLALLGCCWATETGWADAWLAWAW